ncbi:MAG: thioesterase family protein [Dehalococcoidia bacterium]
MTATGTANGEPLFRRTGDTYVPTAMTVGPWSPGALHGGPPTALLARAVEHVAASRGLQVSRLTVDLFRAVPMAPLQVRTKVVREGRRIVAVQASIIAGDVEVSRASGLLLLPSESDDTSPAEPPPPGPAGLPDLLSAMRGPGGERPFPPMFLDAVDARFVAGEGGDGQPAAWFRLPVPLVDGEEPTPFQRLAAVSDFGNLLANFDPSRRRGPGYINTDTTIYLLRYPVSEWVCLRAERRRVQGGLGLVEVAQFDEQGWYGHSAHARLANARRS